MEKNDMLSRLFRHGDRRSFLKACGALGVGAAGGGVLQAVFKVIRIDSGRSSVSQTRLAMGTFVTMTAVDDSQDRAQEAIGLAFEEIDRLVRIFSRHDSATPLSVFNQEGTLPDAPPELIDLVRRSVDSHGLSHGAFDVTVKPLVDLFQQNGDGERAVVATREEIESALERVGSDKIEITASGLRFKRDGMGITLDGIAKGHIVDGASRVLSNHGVRDHLVNAGGDIRASGQPSDRPAWRIAVQDPEKRGKYPSVIELNDGAVATSGNYEVFYDREKVFHHVIDPRTGSSPHSASSVSVVSDSVMWADALSTAVFVLKPSDGVRLIDSLDRAECLVLGDDRSYRSRGWQSSG
jgi:thiamine biosynthesis lipoprotein